MENKTEITEIKSQEQWLALREKDITSTEVAALFNCSPYTTKFELWHKKKGNIKPEFTSNERIKWGSRLEDVIANGIAEDHDLKIKPMKTYQSLAGERAGSSFDYEIGEDGILEIKNVDGLVYKYDWIESEDRSIEAPAHIEMQVQHQLLVSQKKYVIIGALIGGNRTVLIKREPIPSIQEAILREIRAFWHSIDNNIEPVPNFEKDSGAVFMMYQYAQAGKVMDAREDLGIMALALKYKKAADLIKRLEEKKDAAKAELLTYIGDHEKVNGETFTISAGITGPAKIEYERKGFRNFRINWKKDKK